MGAVVVEEAAGIRANYLASWLQGLDVGNCDIILHVHVCEGLMRQLDGSIEKRFARKELMYPIQVCIYPSIPIGPHSPVGLRPQALGEPFASKETNDRMHQLA